MGGRKGKRRKKERKKERKREREEKILILPSNSFFLSHFRPPSFFGEKVACKILKGGVSGDYDEMVNDFFNELALTAPLQHVNVINCYGGCWPEGVLEGDDDNLGSIRSFEQPPSSASDPSTDKKTCLVLELASRGDLGNYVPHGLGLTLDMMVGTSQALACK